MERKLYEQSWICPVCKKKNYYKGYIEMGFFNVKECKPCKCGLDRFSSGYYDVLNKKKEEVN